MLTVLTSLDKIKINIPRLKATSTNTSPKPTIYPQQNQPNSTNQNISKKLTFLKVYLTGQLNVLKDLNFGRGLKVCLKKTVELVEMSALKGIILWISLLEIGNLGMLIRGILKCLKIV